MESIKDIFRKYGVLDGYGRHVNGTDKETNHHYGDAYEQIVGPLRNSASMMMEIGIADGSSLLAWSEVFPNALCIGMDIHPVSKEFWQRARVGNHAVDFILGNQWDKVSCDLAAAGNDFDFICEDGTHLLEDSLRTFLYLWPYVKPGGIYVIEEFANVLSLRDNIKAMWPYAEIVDTIGPSGGVEPLVVFRKPK